MRRLLLVLLVLMAVDASSALARKWASRSGGFAVEAELTDVRDGNAVLRKADGSEVSVPLNTLSLADIRYVQEELQAADKALGVVSSPSAAPGETASAGEASTPAESPSPPTLASPIRYGWKPDQHYMYRVRIEAQNDDVIEALDGTIFYAVGGIAPDGNVELTCSESFRRSREAATGAVAPSPYPNHRSSSRLAATFNPNYWSNACPIPPIASDGLTIDRDGQIVRAERGGTLPYLLKPTAYLPIEQLSQHEGNSWTVSNEVNVTLFMEDWSVRLHRSDQHIGPLPATEKSTYTVQRSDSKGIRLAKTYELASTVLVNGKPRAVTSGNGQLIFDPQVGVFSSSKMKLESVVREAGVALEWTVQVSCELLSEAETAKANAEAEKTKERARELARPIGEEDVDKILQALQSGDAVEMSFAATRLNTKRPQEPNRKMAAGLEALLKSDTPSVRQNAARALEFWATKESVPVLLELLNDEDRLVRSPAIAALGRLKAVEAIDRLIQLWPEEYSVGKAIEAMGPPAEKAVLKQLGSADDRMRPEACRVLQKIGTAKSIRPLEELRQSDDFLTKHSAELALEAIRKRQ